MTLLALEFSSALRSVAIARGGVVLAVAEATGGLGESNAPVLVVHEDLDAGHARCERGLVEPVDEMEKTAWNTNLLLKLHVHCSA